MGTEADYGGQKGEEELYGKRERKKGVEGDKYRKRERKGQNGEGIEREQGGSPLQCTIRWDAKLNE